MVALTAGTRVRADIPRLRKIRARAQPRLVKLFDEAGLPYPCRRVFLRALKHDAELQMWAAAKDRDAMTLVRTYPICASSGELGPKRQQGDEQVPEGCYSIHRYNAWSGFHVSMRVDYPNASDRVRGTRGNLGGAIMVHGGCATIGCIPIEDRPIEEVFIASLDARRAGRHEIPIHIFPTHLDDEGMKMLRGHPDATPARIGLWEELRPIHAAFEETRRVPDIEIDTKTGEYRVVVPPAAT
jgi:murein L,D-transpeptidase YafK